MRVKGYILLGLLLVAGAFESTAQQRQSGSRVTINMRAWRAFPVHVGDSTYVAMVGNVLCYHNGTVITCDSAVQFSDSKAAFYGDVLINKDNTYIYGDRATYDGNRNLARIYSPLIKMRDGDALMYTYNFSFDTKNNVGQFWGGATITQKQTRLEAERGYFYSKRNDFICGGGVELRDTTYMIRSDSMGYNTDSEIATFYAKTYIWSNDGAILSANSGTYHSPTTHYTFFGEAYILNEKRELWADDIDYQTKDSVDYATLKHNIQILDHENKLLGYGDYGQYWGYKDKEKLLLTNNPSIVNFDAEQGDSLYMRADSMWLYTLDSLSIYHSAVRNAEVNAKRAALSADEQEETGAVGILQHTADSNRETAATEQSNTSVSEPNDKQEDIREIINETDSAVVLPVTEQANEPNNENGDIRAVINRADSAVVAPPVIEQTDSIASAEPELERAVLGYRNVKIYRSDFQAVCDSLVSFTVDSTIHLYLKPIIWSDNNQITGEVADIFTKNQTVERALFSGGKPIMASEIDTAHYNQVTGKTIEALFEKGVIYRTNIDGNGQTYYYIQDDKTGDLQGFLTVKCASISFLIFEQTISKIIYRTNPVYAIYPMDKIPAANTERLEGFEWHTAERPLTKEDVCDRIERPSQMEEYRALEQPDFPITETIRVFKERLMNTTRWRDRRDVLTANDRAFIQLILSGEDLK